MKESTGSDFFGGRKPYRVDVASSDSLLSVRDRIRALPAAQKGNGVEVRLAPGRYVLSEPFSLQDVDSGRPGAPIVWRGAPGGGTCLTAGRDIPADMFRPDSARPGTLVADVSAWNVKWPEAGRQEYRDPYPIPEVYVDGERCEPAGWPDSPSVAAPCDTNGGWTVITSFVDEGTRGVNTGASGADNASGPRGGTFGYSVDRPSRWTSAKNIVLHGFWCFDWAESKIAVRSVDAASKTITLAYPHVYGVRNGNPSPRRWRAFNLLEELDRPGECFVDTEKGKVYIKPRRPLSADSRVTVTWAAHHIVSLHSVSNIVLADMELFGSWMNGVSGVGVSDTVLADLDVHGTRLRGIEIFKAQNCTVRTSKVHDVGNGGIYFTGGDRRTLTRGDNVVEDCLVHGFSKNRLTSAYAIHMSGCGNIARHNEMFDAPHQAAGLYGNDNLFEYNVISNVLQCTDDAGAYYTGRNPSCRGNVLRYNYFADMGSDRGYGNSAIYFDDGDGGNEVYGCVFIRCGAVRCGYFGTVFCNGGYSNTVENCLFIDCMRPLGAEPWKQKRWEDYLKRDFMVKNLKRDVDIESPVYLARYPELKGYLPGQPDAIRWNAANNNIFVNPREASLGRWATNSTDVTVKVLPPGDRNAACRAVLPSFKPIPYDKIGRRNVKAKGVTP